MFRLSWSFQIIYTKYLVSLPFSKLTLKISKIINERNKRNKSHTSFLSGSISLLVRLLNKTTNHYKNLLFLYRKISLKLRRWKLKLKLDGWLNYSRYRTTESL